MIREITRRMELPDNSKIESLVESLIINVLFRNKRCLKVKRCFHEET